MNADITAAVEMLARLSRVGPEQRMDTLALVIKAYLEAGSRWSPLADVWDRIEARSGAKGGVR